MARWFTTSSFIPLLLALLSLVGFSSTASADDADAPQAMLVMDYSGSMWGQIEGQPKIDVAREVVSEIMEKWDPRMHLGLIAYGHRRQRDCEDIEVVLPVAADSYQKVRSALYSRSPKGRTPLSASLIKAAKTMDFENRRATVILVSDGLETCGMSPCDVASDLRAQGVDFTVHLVGYDLSPAQRSQLECVATATGGRYLDASSIDALRTAMKTAIEDAITLPDDNFYPVIAEGGKRLDIKAQWEIAASDNPAKVLQRGEGPVFTPNVDPGNYIATATWKGQSASKAVSIRTDSQREHELVIQAGTLTVKALTDSGTTTSWTIVRGESKQTATGNAASMLMPSGSATINATAGTLNSTRTVNVAAGKETTETFDFRSGTVSVKTAGGADVEWTVTRAGTTDVIAKGRGPDFMFSLPPGDYVIVANDGRAKITQNVTVAPNGSHALTFAMQGALQLSAVEFNNGPAAKVAWTVMDEHGNSVFKGENATESTVLPKGTYTIYATHALVTKKTTATIAPAQDSQVNVSLDLGYAELTAIEFDTKTIAVAWQSTIPDRGATNWTAGEKLRVQLPAGTYKITADHPKSIITQDVVVTAGGNTQAQYTMFGQIDLTSFDRKGGKATPVEWIAARSGAEELSALGSNWTLIVPPGKYALTADHPARTINESITVKAGETTRQAFYFDIGTLKMAAFRTNLQEAITANWSIRRQSNGIAGKVVATAQGKAPEITLPAGDYGVTAQTNDGDASETVLVTLPAGELAHANILMYGIVEATAADANNGKATPADWLVSLPRGGEVATANGKTARFVLPRGNFILSANHPVNAAQQAIDIVPGETTTVDLSLDIGYINMAAFRTNANEAIDATWSIQQVNKGKAGKAVAKAQGKAPKITLPAGDYLITAMTDDASESTSITLVAGQTTDASILMYGIVEASITDAANGKATHADWIVALPAGDELATANGPTARFILPRGNYTLNAEHPVANSQQAIDIVPGQTTSASLSFDIGYINMAAFRTNVNEAIDATWSIQRVNRGSAGKVVAKAQGKAPKITLPAGEYLITAHTNDTSESVNVTLPAGKTATANIVLYGIVEANVTDAPNGKAVVADWLVSQPREKAILDKANGKTARFVLPRGTFLISANHPANAATKVANTLPGETTVLTMDLNIGYVNAAAFFTHKGEPLMVQWGLQNVKGGSLLQKPGKTADFIVPAGQYKLVAATEKANEANVIDVTAGQTAKASVIMFGVLQARASDAPKGNNVKVDWAIDGPIKLTVDGQPNIRVALARGAYQLTAAHDAANTDAQIKIIPGKTLHKELPLNIGTAKLRAMETAGGDELDAKWEIRDARSNVILSGSGKSEAVTLAAGQYRYAATHEGVTESTSFTVTAGKQTAKDIALYGVINLSAHATEQGTAENVKWRVSIAGNQGQVYEGFTDKPEIIVPAGEYHVVAGHDLMDQSVKVGVTAGETVDKQLSFTRGTLSVAAFASAGHPVDVAWTVKSKSGRPMERISQTADWIVAPGEYDVTATHEGNTVTKTLTVSAGRATRQQFDLALGQLKLNASFQGKPLHVHWRVQRLDSNGHGKNIFDSIRGKAMLNLRDGKYRVFASHDFVNVMKDVDVRAGQIERVSVRPHTGRLLVVAKDARTDQPVTIMWQLKAGEEDVANHIGADWSEVVPAGEYQLHLRHKGTAQPKIMINITPGQTTTQMIYVWPQD